MLPTIEQRIPMRPYMAGVAVNANEKKRKETGKGFRSVHLLITVSINLKCQAVTPQ